ncbi:MAG: hypothetical protein J5972_02015, partial [Eubacterium sp.]|nr:hypothetical protein [Eubacterium sp.]
MNKRVKQMIALATAATLLVGCGATTLEDAKEARESMDLDFSVDLKNIKAADVDGGESVHDPSIMEADGKYYIYGSHMSAAYSTDLRKWEFMINEDFIPSSGYDVSN